MHKAHIVRVTPEITTRSPKQTALLFTFSFSCTFVESKSGICEVMYFLLLCTVDISFLTVLEHKKNFLQEKALWFTLFSNHGSADQVKQKHLSMRDLALLICCLGIAGTLSTYNITQRLHILNLQIKCKYFAQCNCVYFYFFLIRLLFDSKTTLIIVLRRNRSPKQNIVCGLLWNNHSSSRYKLSFIKTKNFARDCLPRLEMM